MHDSMDLLHITIKMHDSMDLLHRTIKMHDSMDLLHRTIKMHDSMDLLHNNIPCVMSILIIDKTVVKRMRDDIGHEIYVLSI